MPDEDKLPEWFQNALYAFILLVLFSLFAFALVVGLRAIA